MAKHIFRNMLLTALTVTGLAAGLVACSSDDDDKQQEEKGSVDNRTEAEKKLAAQQFNAVTYILKTLTGADKVGTDFDTKTYAPTYGQVLNASTPFVRALKVSDYDEAELLFSYMVGSKALVETTTDGLAVTLKDMLLYADKPQTLGTLTLHRGSGEAVAYVDVDIPCIPTLQRIDFVTTLSTNAGSESPYKVGQIVRVNDALGNFVPGYYLCVSEAPEGMLVHFDSWEERSQATTPVDVNPHFHSYLNNTDIDVNIRHSDLDITPKNAGTYRDWRSYTQFFTSYWDARWFSSVQWMKDNAPDDIEDVFPKPLQHPCDGYVEFKESAVVLLGTEGYLYSVNPEDTLGYEIYYSSLYGQIQGQGFFIGFDADMFEHNQTEINDYAENKMREANDVLVMNVLPFGDAGWDFATVVYDGSLSNKFYDAQSFEQTTLDYSTTRSVLRTLTGEDISSAFFTTTHTSIYGVDKGDSVQYRLIRQGQAADRFKALTGISSGSTVSDGYTVELKDKNLFYDGSRQTLGRLTYHTGNGSVEGYVDVAIPTIPGLKRIEYVTALPSGASVSTPYRTGQIIDYQGSQYLPGLYLCVRSAAPRGLMVRFSDEHLAEWAEPNPLVYGDYHNNGFLHTNKLYIRPKQPIVADDFYDIDAFFLDHKDTRAAMATWAKAEGADLTAVWPEIITYSHRYLYYGGINFTLMLDNDAFLAFLEQGVAAKNRSLLLRCNYNDSELNFYDFYDASSSFSIMYYENFFFLNGIYFTQDELEGAKIVYDPNDYHEE